VTGTVVERRTFAAPTAATYNVLKGGVPQVAVTSNNANPDTNHATTVTVNGVTVDSGAATKVPFLAAQTAYATGVAGTANLPVVTAEAAAVGDTVAYPSVAVPYTLNVGTATAPAGPGTHGAYGPALSAPVATPFAPLSSKLTAGNGALGSECGIMDVGSGAAGSTATMQWRTRATNEMAPTATHPPVPAGAIGMISDIADVTGVTGTYVLQMTYDDSMFGGSQAGKHSAFMGDALYLASMNPTTGYFENATARDVGVGTSVVAKYEGSWSQFIVAGGPGNGKSIDSLLGSWGADTSGTTAWAVVNHSSEFGVVPEPGTLGLLAAAALALSAFLWRSRRRTP
jgi:hypothetical protein